ncbi:peptidase family M48-domain-containing protein [Aspergillus ambiguus]|uniref:M48 family metallopeptidase n=1 Tax=Aspergillus ambiguus TaxID=176160 RepID=UPI003CCD528D
MFRTPITRPFLRASLLPLPSLHAVSPRPSITLSLRSPRRLPYASQQPFSTSVRRCVYGGNQYNRFNTSREPLLTRLLRNAKPHHFVIIGLTISGFYLYNTETVEMTGRRRFNCVSPKWELQMGVESYREVLNQERGKILPANHPLTVSVNRVLQRLIPQAQIEGADWQVHVIDEPQTKNAFVLPGGKVFVYTGILPICKDEDGLAAVLGHEIAHVVARHPAERMSGGFLTFGVVFLISLLFDISGQFPSLLLNLMYSLPNSRTQEGEADNIGLMMMSKACFDPGASVELWARMQQAEKQAPPEFLSTHPSSYNRMETIKGMLYKAEGLYEDSGCNVIRGFMPGFHQASSGW